MAFNQDAPQGSVNAQSPGPLENRLRNLILSNTDASEAFPAHRHAPPQSYSSHSAQSLSSAPLPVSMDTRFQEPNLGHVAGAPGDVDGEEIAKKQAIKSGRKRPNQAQRRQMSSQLVIPVDTRPQQNANRARTGNETGTNWTRGPAQSYRQFRNDMHHPAALDSRNEGQQSPRGPSFSPHQHGGAYVQGPPNAPSQHYPASPARRGFGPVGGPNGGYRRQHVPQFSVEEVARQSNLLEELCYHVVVNSEIARTEIAEKEAFRRRIEAICQSVIAQYENSMNNTSDFPAESVELKCFGSLSSGFATKAADMDLGLLSPLSRIPPDTPASPIPRLIEKAFLDAGLGARLLSRTRVPIIKLCESPPERLRKNLLAEREKWESGNDGESTAQQEGDEVRDDGAGDLIDEETSDIVQHGSQILSNTEFEVPTGRHGEVQRFYLRQEGKKLATYYGQAQRLLRKAGGRDVSDSNHGTMIEQEWVILNRICQAFVQGLSDADLRARLAQYPSLSFDPTCDMHIKHSLAATYNLVEGEDLLQTWRSCSLREEMMSSFSQEERVIRSWDEVLGKKNFGVEVVAYIKEVQIALDKIKKIPSIQVLSLEQGQHETAAQYHFRAKGLANQLRMARKDADEVVMKELYQRYVLGIANKAIRNAVEAAKDEFTNPWDFEALGRRHKSLHLAQELEHALEKGLYDAIHTEDIREYVKLLRSPLRKPEAAGHCASPALLVPQAYLGLVARIRELPDPHMLASSQMRERQRELEFSKDVGVQCDINFSAQLALHNTLLLRCYSHTDPRVRPMVLFVKHWAKVRGINSGYRGTLSSYGYVLMVLHYLVNVAQPFVCPNLQHLGQSSQSAVSQSQAEDIGYCKGYNVQFWRNEAEIVHLARNNLLNHNKESLGHLLRGFFEYYAHSGLMSNGCGRGFDWGRDVLSLRTPGGRLSKQEKGWTGARTVREVQETQLVQETKPAQQPNHPPTSPPVETHAAGQSKAPKAPDVKEVRHRYLFAIEDPFETDHNVARTVMHSGIVSIRDEFRRAWNILQAAGKGLEHDELLKDLNDSTRSSSQFMRLLDEIHGFSSA
ncbi:hypothetical protein S7711_01895 [Stachybotrys chartarum IBT 7711]|uniref:polynucleotide adenylyltransferase n=1 Tax=Stachybotrys chartarum (strain CBS 109288 / IBT 7711) TaxID=1280523 RepID=A0A084AMS2_STACB|nr:hypothetical protein S7711_01895 [Stachybotrys chartarum IBT 7711]KFA48721.1 hypothetical protein S40293_01583 [Stachybotrys chartarum IBT 40293]